VVKKTLSVLLTFIFFYCNTPRAGAESLGDAPAQHGLAGYFRQPTINGNTIIFVCEDDLWTVPLVGGTARRLTAGRSDCSSPHLSPDGSMVGGGNVSALLLEKLNRKRVAYAVSRWGQPEPYPHESVAGPMVAITDQFAGSDGDIFSHCFKLYKLGPLVGKRTWDGVIGISTNYQLVDGTLTTQPEFSFWFKDVGWKVENYGTDPDYEVDIAPQDFHSGRDPQLAKALELMISSLSQTPVQLPAFGPHPSRALPAKLGPSEAAEHE